MAVPRSNFKSLIIAIILLVLGLGTAAVLYRAASTSTERRSRAAQVGTVYKAWEFNKDGDTEGWAATTNVAAKVSQGLLVTEITTGGNLAVDALGSITNEFGDSVLPRGNKSLKLRLAVSDGIASGVVVKKDDAVETVETDAKQIPVKSFSSLTAKVCTDDVKKCPDGSYVSRIPPACEFAPCPGSQPSLSSCRPRPACLDVKPPCEIAEPIGGWCPPTPKPTCIPRPACLDAPRPCKIPEKGNYCPPRRQDFTFRITYVVKDARSVPKQLVLIGKTDGQQHEYELKFPEIDSLTITKLEIVFASLNIGGQASFDWIRLVGPGPTPITIPAQKIRQAFIDETGKTTYARTCIWNNNREAAENCSTWESFAVPNLPSQSASPIVKPQRMYSGFIFDAWDESRVKIQKIRQIILADDGMLAYYRTCHWDQDSMRPIKCTPENAWGIEPLNNITGTGDTSYRSYAAFVYDSLNKNAPFPQNVRQVFVDASGTKTYARTCTWNWQRGEGQDCTAWETSNIPSYTNSDRPPAIRQYGAFIFDDKTEAGNAPQKIRQFIINDTGTSSYYRTCRWDAAIARPVACQPENTWIETKLSNITGGNNPSYRSFAAFVFDYTKPIPPPISTLPPLSTPSL